MSNSLSVLLAVSVVLASVAPAGAETEQAANLATAEVLSGLPLTGPGYSIAQTVLNDGAINTFVVSVDGTAYEVRGNALMRARLGELTALQQLRAIKGTDVYKQAVEKAATGPLRTAKNMVTAPIDTLEGIGRGIGTFFTGIGHAAFGGASEQESGVLKTAIGFDNAKRQFAYRVGVDPYTTFPPVATELSDLAWAAVGGGLTVSIGFAAIPGTAGSVVSGTKTGDTMNRLVRDNSPAELKKINATKLRAMQIDASVADIFLEHPKLSPTRKTRIVGALAGMKNVRGRQIFIDRAILAADDEQAFQIQYWAESCATYHARVKPVAAFVQVGSKNTPVMRRADGALIAVVPLDHVAWTPGVATSMTAVERSLARVKAGAGKELWLDGSASPLAKQTLAKQSWTVVEDSGKKLGLY